MKKLGAFLLAFTLAAAMGTPALAENITNTGNDATRITVNGEYDPGTTADVIFVDISWDPLEFTYNASGDVWDPATHDYETSTKTGWSWNKADSAKTAPEITLTNHSNVGVKAKFGFAPSTEITGLNGKFTNTDGTALIDNAFTLDTAVRTNVNEAPSNSTAFSLEGGSITGEGVTLGEITVTINKDGSADGDTDDPGTTRVSDADALKKAIKDGNSPIIKLTTDLKLSDELYLGGYNGTIDLNGKTLKFSGDNSAITSGEKHVVTINNGTIESEDCALAVNSTASVTVNNCTIITTNDNALAAVVIMGNAALNNCTINSSTCGVMVVAPSSRLTLSGDIRITAKTAAIELADDSANVTCLAGTYNFDPSAYVGKNTYEVNEDSATGIWTVAAKTN